eukprot:1181464-Prorocentrum_minimum.AAC.4
MRQRAALLSLYTHGAAAHVDYETAQHRTVLIEAAEAGVVDFVSDLVKWGESVDYETLLGRTALTQSSYDDTNGKTWAAPKKMAADWSITRIYPHVLHPIGPS